MRICNVMQSVGWSVCAAIVVNEHRAMDVKRKNSKQNNNVVVVAVIMDEV